MESPCISVIIPATKGKAVVSRSVESAIGQTVPDLEVIIACCEPAGMAAKGAEALGAPDERTEALASGECPEAAAAPGGLGETAQERDGRVRVVRPQGEAGRFEALRAGVSEARGEFAVIVEAGDEMQPDFAERLLESQGGKFDIVQCAMEMHCPSYLSAGGRRFDEEYNRPPALTARGDNVTHVAFRDHRTTWGLGGKLFRASLLKRAFAELPPNAAAQAGGFDASLPQGDRLAASLPQAEDACLYFVASCLADSYKGVPKYWGYIRNASSSQPDGSWGKLSLGQFESACRSAHAAGAIETFLTRSGKLDALGDDLRSVRSELARDVAELLAYRVEPADKARAYDAFASAWAPEEAVAALSDACWEDAAGCLNSVAGAQSLKCGRREVKTVAALHYRMQVGGAERVAADLAQLWTNLGLRVVFFADEPRTACAYDLPDSVTWVELPPAARTGRGDFLARARAMAGAMRRYQVDALVHHQWWSHLMAWELLLAKTMGIPVCAVHHSIYLAQYIEPEKGMYDYSRIARHADMLVTLSEFDKAFWERFNPRVRCTINPITTQPGECRRSKLQGKNIVWVGRLSHFDKQPQEAVEIMARVVARDPECTLTIVGEAPTKQEFSELKALVRQYGLEDNVEFAGLQTDTAPYYERASVHLLTSRFEGWCLTLAESKAHGLPCVMYDLPYLTLTQGKRGIVAAPQGDRDEAASAIVALLAHDDERKRLGQQAFDDIVEIAATDRPAFWAAAFAELAQGSPAREGFELADAQWDLLIDSLKASIDKALDCPLIPYSKRKGKKLAKKVLRRIRPH